MNMKKTIAAIAAGAVAVSAMATTVSAVESGTFNYNLVNTLQNQKNGKVTIKATFPNVKLVAGTTIDIGLPGMGWTDKVVVSGQYIDTNKAINPITFTRDVWSEGYSAETEAQIGWEKVTLQVKSVNDGTPYTLIGGAAEATDGTEGTAASLTAVASTGHILAVNEAILKANGVIPGTYTLTYRAGKDAVEPVAAGWYTDAAKTIKVSDAAILAALAGKEEEGKAAAGVKWETTTYYYDAGSAGTAKVEAGWFDANDKAPTFYGVDATAIAAPVAGNTIVVNYNAGTEGTKGTDVVMANLTVTVNMKSITDKDWETVNGKLKNHTYGISLNGVFGDATGSAYTAPTAYKAPFMTQSKEFDKGYQNIINYLNTANVNGDDKAYKNVGAVINDAIENFETVTFTFNTAAANVRFAAATGSYTNPVINHDNINKEYNDTLKKLATGEFIVGLYAENDWEGVDTYKAFGDHTYDWFYTPEGTGFTGMDWGGQNLFAGALIVNEGLTMSLSNTEYFDWTKTAISFDWDAIMDGAATTNNYATYIHSIKLATSNMWFWDSMDLVLVAGTADTVDADAAAEVDEDTIDEDKDDIDADDDDDVEPADDDDDDEDVAPVVDEPAPALVVSNPPTGNAPVALAVIPVALAAAAIVAKKRG